MRISDWSSDVCSSDLLHVTVARLDADQRQQPGADGAEGVAVDGDAGGGDALDEGEHWLVGTGNGGWSWSWSWSLGSIAFVPSFPRKREPRGFVPATSREAKTLGSRFRGHDGMSVLRCSLRRCVTACSTHPSSPPPRPFRPPRTRKSVG